MIVVLEGPDGSGKTTLAKFMTERWDAHYMHLTYRFKDRMFDYHTAALEKAIKLSKAGKTVIIDRWWPSINIYDDVFRQRRSFEFAGRMLDRAGMHAGVVYVSCLPKNREFHLAEFEERRAAGGEMYDSVAEVTAEYALWDTECLLRPDVLHYDRFEMGNRMGQFADDVRHRWFALNSRIPYWFQETRQTGGNIINPRLFIIGERSNPKGRHRVWPFFEHSNSSLWLTSALDKAQVPEHSIVWANAVDHEGRSRPELLSRIYNEAAHALKGVVALGKRAQIVAANAGISHYCLPHPAYVKRFQRGDQTEYINLFQDLAR